jgi:hypothetical protein
MSTTRDPQAPPEAAPAPGGVTIESGSDGLADALGPIPAFGPARTDAHGRIVMTDEEWEARLARFA